MHTINKIAKSYKELLFLNKLDGIDTRALSTSDILQIVGPDFNKPYVWKKLKKYGLPFARNFYSHHTLANQFINQLLTIDTSGLSISEIVARHRPTGMSTDYACRLIRKHDIPRIHRNSQNNAANRLLNLMTSIEALHDKGIPVTRRAIATFEGVTPQRVSEKYAAYRDVIAAHRDQTRLATTLKSMNTEAMSLCDLMTACNAQCTQENFRRFLNRYNIAYRKETKITLTSKFREALNGQAIEDMDPNEICRLYAPSGLSHASAKAILYQCNLINRKHPKKGIGRTRVKQERLQMALQAVAVMKACEPAKTPTISSIAKHTGMTASSLYKYPELKPIVTGR